jgi:hypothetical protein
MLVARTVFALLASAVAASALPISWTLTGITFDDGGGARGSFTFNPDTGTPCGPFITPCGTYSNINITTTTGGFVTGANYVNACGSDVPTCFGLGPNADNTAVLFLTSQAVDQTGLPALLFFFTPPFAGLTDAGGTIDLSGSSGFNVAEFVCGDSGCDFPDSSSGFRFGNAGSVTGGGLVDSVAPEPSSALLLLGGAVTMLGLGRFRKMF